MSTEFYFYHLNKVQAGFHENAFCVFMFKYAIYPAQAVAIFAFIVIILSFFKTSPKALFGRPALALVMTMVIGAGFITHTLLKDHWGRPRPRQVINFGGNQLFRPYYQPNFFHQPEPSKSFPCGHCTMGFYFFSVALLCKRLKANLLYYFFFTFAIALGCSLGLARMMVGGHFLSDVIVTGIIMWITAYTFDSMFCSNREKKMKGLTKRQQEILYFIETFINTHRYSPSYREIKEHFGFKSLGTVNNHLQILKRKGVLEGEEKKSRSLIPLYQKEQAIKGILEVKLPFIGHIKGGEPISTFPQAQSICVPTSMVHAPDKTYVFRIMGDNLIDEHLIDGDLLLIEAREKADPGETIVAAIHHDEIIIKMYYPEGQYIRLVSHSSLQAPYFIQQSDLSIKGIVVGLIRIFQ